MSSKNNVIYVNVHDKKKIDRTIADLVEQANRMITYEWDSHFME